MPRVTGIFIYPVKSLRGIEVSAARVDDLGFVNDRRFLVVDESGQFLTQRAVPRMACVAAKLHAGILTLSTGEQEPLAIPLRPASAGRERTVSVWKSEGLVAVDCGDAAADWLTTALGQAVRLVRIGERFVRPILKAAAHPGDRVTFADACPFLLTSEASLRDLNDRILAAGGEPVPMNRFRPNLVVAGCAPFAEDAWQRIAIGDVIFRNGGPCARCIMTTTDQLTGARGKEPLRTLAAFRRDPGEPSNVNFGINLIAESKSGTGRIGDDVRILD